jgi:Leucine-rich repeat (LRR) protein
LILDYWKYFKDDKFTVLSSLHNLTTLKINNTTFSSVGAAAVSELPKLKTLEVKYCNIDDSVIETLSTLTTLETFEFHSGWSYITDRSLPHLGKFTKLTELSLNKSKITDDGLAYLSTLTLLSSLSLSNTLISAKGIAYLSSLRYLQQLYLDNCYNLTEQIGSTLAKMPYLHTLSLENCPTKSLQCFKYMNRSTVLKCLNCNQNLNRVHSKVIKEITSKFPQIQNLSLSGSRISCTFTFSTSLKSQDCCFISLNACS